MRMCFQFWPQKRKKKKEKRMTFRTTVAYGESVKCKFFCRAGFHQRLYARAWGLKRPRNGDLITRSRYLYNLGNSISPRKKGDFDERTLSRKFRTNQVRFTACYHDDTYIHARDFTSSGGYVQLKKIARGASK